MKKVITPGYYKTYMWSRKSAFPKNDLANAELRRMRFNYLVP